MFPDGLYILAMGQDAFKMYYKNKVMGKILDSIQVFRDKRIFNVDKNWCKMVNAYIGVIDLTRGLGERLVYGKQNLTKNQVLNYEAYLFGTFALSIRISTFIYDFKFENFNAFTWRFTFIRYDATHKVRRRVFQSRHQLAELLLF